MISTTKRLDWFAAPFDSEELWGAPGVRMVGSGDGRLLVHRTHLPLLTKIDPSRFLAGASGTRRTWAERNAWCAERGITLRNTQHQAIDFANGRRGVLLFDEQRLGKTLSALMMDAEWRADHVGRMPYGPLMICAPLSTRGVWLSWLRRVFPNVEIGVITGRTFDKEILQKPIIFGHYDIIHKWQTVLNVGTVIFDEVQALTGRGTRRTKAATLLAERARNVICATGTPINKFPPDMWPVLNLVAPGAWGTYHEFSARYGAPETTAHGVVYRGISNEAELKARLNEIMIRRLWVDCCDDLPAISRSVVVADLSQAERNKLDILAAQIKSDRANTAGSLAAYRRQVTLIKLSTVIEQAERVMASGERVVVWTWHKDFAEKLHRRFCDGGHNAFVIHGDINIAERERRIEAWRDVPSGVLVANMAVAGAGIDLSAARIAIFAEIDYTPSVLGQAEMRTFALGRPMDVIFVVAGHYVDQRIVRSLVSKLSASDPLGVAAAIDAIDALRDAVLGPEEEGDLDRLLEDLINSG